MPVLVENSARGGTQMQPATPGECPQRSPTAILHARIQVERREPAGGSHPKIGKRLRMMPISDSQG
jgi:hypothetical protein